MMRVIKVGGRAQADPALARMLAAEWCAEPGMLCVVHGGGDEISALQHALGATPAFAGGRRVTTASDIDLIRMALSGSANKRLVSALVSSGVSALGLSGEDAGLIVARPSDVAELGHVGVPHRINVSMLRHLLDGGFLPVISPLARAERAASVPGAAADSPALNVNGDDAAAAIAIALGAAELLFAADVAGVLARGVPLADLDADAALEMIAAGGASGGMAAKLQAGIAALEGGVAQVRIGDTSAVADPALGTVLTLARSIV